MEPIDIAWQLLRKAAGIEGPVDPRRPGMSPGMSGTTGRMQSPQDDLPPEAYEQLNQALEEEARLREEGMTSEGAHTPSTPTLPPAYERSMRRAPPTPEELGGDDVSGFPPHLQHAYAKYAKPRSARGGRPPQGTSVQNPDDVLRSMSPIELAMDTLQKRTPRSYRGEAGYEQFAPHAMTAGADTPEDFSQEEYQQYLDAAARMNMDADAPMDSSSDIPMALSNPGRASEIPVEDPARHHQLDVGRQAAMREGVDIQQTRTPPADAIRRTRNDAEIPKNPFSRGPSL